MERSFLWGDRSIPGTRRPVPVTGGDHLRFFRKDSRGCWEVLSHYDRQDVGQQVLSEQLSGATRNMERVIYPAVGVGYAIMTSPIWAPYAIAAAPKVLTRAAEISATRPWVPDVAEQLIPSGRPFMPRTVPGAIAKGLEIGLGYLWYSREEEE